ncbi:hypothetical protein [Curvibacter lanceolatus]|uniref:hypothetical protein n=1 Tax=Curvibacter lanceolatus TaxID=86182 RepID=UPI001FE16168|nr:hypothetical protein [Curvibacter lanceolatus]
MLLQRGRHGIKSRQQLPGFVAVALACGGWLPVASGHTLRHINCLGQGARDAAKDQVGQANGRQQRQHQHCEQPQGFCADMLCHPVFFPGTVGFGGRDGHVHRVAVLFVQGVESLQGALARLRMVVFQAGQVVLPDFVKEGFGGNVQVIQHVAG